MSKRRLSADERSLWTHVTRSIAPLAKRRAAQVDDGESATPIKSKTKAKLSSGPLPVATPVTPRPVARAMPHPESAPAPLGRKARRRLARGVEAIDGRLDLHGMTQARAHDALLGFLRAARGKGAKVVLVITGKGGDSYGERGVLKRQVPMWLRLPEFREFVVGFETAGIGHGGEGALYVRVRRARG
jgi:DNA-nicking Smr family endonuclease